MSTEKELISAKEDFPMVPLENSIHGNKIRAGGILVLTFTQKKQDQKRDLGSSNSRDEKFKHHPTGESWL